MGANATKTRDITLSGNQSSDNEWQTSPNRLYLRKKDKPIDQDSMDNLETSNKKINCNDSQRKSLAKIQKTDLVARDKHLSKEYFSNQHSFKVNYD